MRLMTGLSARPNGPQSIISPPCPNYSHEVAMSRDEARSAAGRIERLIA
jgi:hypothetical protein